MPELEYSANQQVSCGVGTLISVELLPCRDEACESGLEVSLCEIALDQHQLSVYETQPVLTIDGDIAESLSQLSKFAEESPVRELGRQNGALGQCCESIVTPNRALDSLAKYGEGLICTA